MAFILFTEPTQIYRFLRTRNMLSVSYFYHILTILNMLVIHYDLYRKLYSCDVIYCLCFQPVFLNRTLSYMKQRMSRTHKHRKGFKVDCLLDRLNTKNREIQPGNLEGYMTLTFLGFYDKKCKFLKIYLSAVKYDFLC